MKKIITGFVISTMVLGSVTPVMAVQTPELYPNDYAKRVGPTQNRADVNACKVRAEDYTSQSKSGRPVLRDTARGAARGAALGALGGAIFDDKAGRGAGAGAAVGGLSALGSSAREQREGSPEYKKYVEACLEDKGYKVVGWR